MKKYTPPEVKKPDKMVRVRGQHKTFQDTNNIFMTTTTWMDINLFDLHPIFTNLMSLVLQCAELATDMSWFLFHTLQSSTKCITKLQIILINLQKDTLWAGDVTDHGCTFSIG